MMIIRQHCIRQPSVNLKQTIAISQIPLGCIPCRDFLPLLALAIYSQANCVLGGRYPSHLFTLNLQESPVRVASDHLLTKQLLKITSFPAQFAKTFTCSQLLKSEVQHVFPYYRIFLT